MSEDEIRRFAKRHGLDVYKRITTGNDKAHFATFELSPPAPEPTGPNMLEAWRAVLRLENADRLKGSAPFTLFHARSEIDGLAWIEFSSVWCEPGR